MDRTGKTINTTCEDRRGHKVPVTLTVGDQPCTPLGLSLAEK